MLKKKWIFLISFLIAIIWESMNFYSLFTEPDSSILFFIINILSLFVLIFSLLYIITHFSYLKNSLRKLSLAKQSLLFLGVSFIVTLLIQVYILSRDVLYYGLSFSDVVFELIDYPSFFAVIIITFLSLMFLSLFCIVILNKLYIKENAGLYINPITISALVFFLNYVMSAIDYYQTCLDCTKGIDIPIYLYSSFLLSIMANFLYYFAKTKRVNITLKIIIIIIGEIVIALLGSIIGIISGILPFSLF